MSTEEREKQIREREAKATKGPWEVMPDSVIQYMNRIWADGCDVCCCEGDGSLSHERSDNENFIAHARADIPWLLSQLGELRSAAKSAMQDCLTEQECRVANQDAVWRLESELEGMRREIEAFKKGRT